MLKYLIFILIFSNILPAEQKKEDIPEKIIKPRIYIAADPSYKDLETAFLSLQNVHKSKDVRRDIILRKTFYSLIYNILRNNNNNFASANELMSNFKKTFCEKFKLSEDDSNLINDMICIGLITENLSVGVEIALENIS